MYASQPVRVTNAKPYLAIVAICAMLFPILVFYGLLARYAIDIPYVDDYSGVLDFLEHYSRLPSAAARFGYVISAQHNEYKTIFANAIIALQYRFSGHPDFVTLSWIGNIFVLILFILIWRHFMADEHNIPRRLMYFIPVSYLLFQLQYAETLNWSMPGLQNIPVLIFAFASTAFLSRERTTDFVIACIFMALTIAASGNGFALFPVGVMMLLQRKAFARIGVWVLVTGICASIYFHHYDVHSSQQQPGGSVLYSAHYLNPIFTLSFMGSAMGSYYHALKYLSVFLGVLICIASFMMVKYRYDKRNPTIFYFVGFLVLTAIAVSGIRSKLGFGASIAGRYKIYSDLLLICCYVFFVEVYVRTARARRTWLVAAIVFSVLFSARSDRSGNRYLVHRDADMVAGARLYESSNHKEGPVVMEGTDQSVVAAQINKTAHSIMDESETTGLYRFP